MKKGATQKKKEKREEYFR